MNEAEASPNMDQKCPQCGAPLPSGVLAGLCPACLFKQGAATDTAAPPETAPFLPPGVEEVARLFPQLEIIALIGKGGMGAVYKARQPGLDRIVALKILPPQTAGGPGFIERFNREARALAKLNHPNIVTVYEFGQVNGLPFFIMEFVDGLNLRQLEQSGKLSASEALQIVPQICEALQFAHDEGIVHRDIKPENILVDKKGRVKIADFGIAKILGRQPDVSITETGGTVGTPHYMAPEQMEKPATVDHRADIFSLGVVFYEMLTGELPLGKFAPPSSRKVEVDVRLDDVVLRALEKDPERRYQHASQVKTAVDTIAGGAAPPPSSSAADATALAREILARDYTVSIRSCLRRAWVLMQKDFWPLVGVTALILALLGFVSSFGGATFRHGTGGDNSAEISSFISMLVWGPLLGGLSLFYLKKIRGQPVNIEVAFSGLTHHFLHLFLAGFVISLLTWLGFLCLVLPGIYLIVAWWFTLTLVIDKQFDFWSAMELSRKVVTRHWWKLFGLFLVVLLLYALGVMFLLVGLLITAPLAMIAATYAYEDIFGQSAVPAGSSSAKTGPGGTTILPTTPPPLPSHPKNWSSATKIGLAVVVVVIGLFLLSLFLHSARKHRQPQDFAQQVATVQMAQSPPPLSSDAPTETVAPVPPVVFGAIIEQELTNLETINLASNQTAWLPESITAQNRGPEKDTAAFAWMTRAGMDLAYLGGYDGFYGLTRDMITLPRDDWDNYRPEQLAAALHDTGQDMPEKFGDASPLNNPTNFIYGFKTRDGALGLLQVTGSSGNPSGVMIQYKLVPPAITQATNPDGSLSPDAQNALRETLNERLDAASSINDISEKDRPLAAIASDAAKAGEVEIVQKALAQMYSQDHRDDAAGNAARLLAKRGLRKQAIELAKDISNYTTRNQVLSELAQ